ncbi:MAG: MBL fold metallo-hydrolase [Ginsengibacter sp.]
MNSPELKITFLGTGTSSGVPMIACNCDVCTSIDTKDKRLRSSILVQSSTTTIVVDTTPDFRTQMLRENVTQLDAILFTHPHKDHVAGMDDIRAFTYFQNKPMDIYANELTQEALQRDFFYIFAQDKFPGIASVNMHTVTHESFMVGDISITPIWVLHLRMPVVGYRFGDITYITDANQIMETEKDKIRGSKILIINALRKKAHISHFTLQEAIDLSSEIQIPETYLTHISHQMGKYEVVSQELPPNIHFGYDGLQLKV